MPDGLAAHPLGTRVALRHRLPEPDPATGSTFTETVGVLVEITDDTLTLRTRRGGVVRVSRSAVVSGRVVPPAPVRRGPPHLALAAEDLQRVMVDAWPPIEREELGGWLLRAARGFTHRANSALAVGDPGRPVDAALDAVEDWYAARGLPSGVVLVGAAGFEPWSHPLGAPLRARGYDDRVQTLTLTAAAREVAVTASEAPDGWEVRLEANLTPEWLAAYGRYRSVDEVAARAILTGSPEQVFASVRQGEDVVALGRLGLAHAWGGIAAMWVGPQARRRGLGRAVVGALARAASARGIRSLHLQTDADNPGALALYESVGFTRQHGYVNLSR